MVQLKLSLTNWYICVHKVTIDLFDILNNIFKDVIIKTFLSFGTNIGTEESFRTFTFSTGISINANCIGSTDWTIVAWWKTAFTVLTKKFYFPNSNNWVNNDPLRFGNPLSDRIGLKNFLWTFLYLDRQSFHIHKYNRLVRWYR